MHALSASASAPAASSISTRAGSNRARERIGGRVQGAADRALGGARAAAGEQQLREPRLRLATEPARLAIVTRRGVELAPQSVDFTLEVESAAGRPVPRSLRPCERAARDREGVRPGTGQLEHLAAAHEAGAGKGRGIGLLGAPPRERRRPLAGARQRVDLVAGLEHAAVHETGEEGRELARDDRDHRLVEQREARVDSSEPHQGAALDVPRGGGQLRVAETDADRHGVARGGERRVDHAARQVELGSGKREIAVLDAVDRLDQPAAAGDPSVRGAELAAQERAERQPESGARSARRFAGRGVGPVKPFERALELELAAGHVGRDSEPLEIIGLEGPGAIDVRERREGVVPS